MQTQSTRRIQAAACLFFAASALTLAGCGNQANTPATPVQIQQGKQMEQQAAFSRTPAGGQKPPAAPPVTGSASSASQQNSGYGPSAPR